MSYKVDNAIIMAAGLSSRFVPLSYEMPKALVTVKGERLIERQIRQLQEAGITEIIVITGYLDTCLQYLQEKYHVTLLHNPLFETRNNNYSLYLAKDYIKNTYICSADNYFSINPFTPYVEESYYAAVYVEGKSEEWCLKTNDQDYIVDVEIGGEHSWVMMGHVFFSESFSNTFCKILSEEIQKEETKQKLWEKIYMEHIDQLPMKIRRYQPNEIYEFDTLDELRRFDHSYQTVSNSIILQDIALQLHGEEGQIANFQPLKNEQGAVYGMQFAYRGNTYHYDYEERKVVKHE